MSIQNLPAVQRIVLGESVATLVKVGYSLAEMEAAARKIGKDLSEARIARHIHAGNIPARHTGRRYIVAGGVIVDLLGGAAVDTVNDHRWHIRADNAYSFGDTAVLLGVSYKAVLRLADNGRLEPDLTHRGRRVYSGARLLDYLNGSDKPITHSASA